MIQAGYDIREVIQLPSPSPTTSSSAIEQLKASMKGEAHGEPSTPTSSRGGYQPSKTSTDAAPSTMAPPGLQQRVCCALCEGKGWVTPGSRQNLSKHSLEHLALSNEVSLQMAGNRRFDYRNFQDFEGDFWRF